MTRRKLLMANLVVGGLVALGLVIYGHLVRRPQPLDLTGASFYWTVGMQVRGGVGSGRAVIKVTMLYHGTGTASTVTWAIRDARGHVLDQGAMAGPVHKQQTTVMPLKLVDPAPPNWDGGDIRIHWREIKPSNPGGQLVTVIIPLAVDGVQ